MRRFALLAALLLLPFTLGNTCVVATNTTTEETPAEELPPDVYENARDTAPDDVRTIEDFVDCLNTQAIGGDIVDAVACLPRGCTLTSIQSDESAQPACAIGACQLPRVILDCPGPPQFMPSFTLCATHAQRNSVEIGEVVDTDGNMRMGDVHVGPNYTYTDPTSAVSKIDTVSDTMGCWGCHGNHNSGDPEGSEAISEPMGIFGRGCVLETNEPCEEEDGNSCDGEESVTVESLEATCQCISDDIDAGGDLDTEDGQRALDLCNALVNYRNTRGVCGSAGPDLPSGPMCLDLDEPCDPYDGGATTAFDTGYSCQEVDVDDWQCVSTQSCVDYQLGGGGKFLDGTAVSFVRMDVSGQTVVDGSGEVCDYSEILSEIETFNHASNAQAGPVDLTQLSVTDQGGGDFSAYAEGTATVDGGGPVNVTLDAGKSGASVAFDLEDSDTPETLAGYTGEAGRSDLSFTTTPATTGP